MGGFTYTGVGEAICGAIGGVRCQHSSGHVEAVLSHIWTAGSPHLELKRAMWTGDLPWGVNSMMELKAVGLNEITTGSEKGSRRGGKT